jgi:hypothetical protein
MTNYASVTVEVNGLKSDLRLNLDVDDGIFTEQDIFTLGDWVQHTLHDTLDDEGLLYKEGGDA